jgi:REP element-mobilizing transposase RayT
MANHHSVRSNALHRDAGDCDAAPARSERGAWKVWTAARQRGIRSLMPDDLRFADLHAHTRRLPHWELEGAVYFLTFRLADSLPARALVEWEAELSASKRPATEIARERFRRMERALDAGRGSCALAHSEIAQTVVENLRHFDPSRYHLLAWCVMPNHVHVVAQLASEISLAKVLLSWKSYTARRANTILGRSGVFWQREYFDRIIRDAAHLGRAVRYVRDNPAKAGLKDWPWVWVREDLQSW